MATRRIRGESRTARSGERSDPRGCRVAAPADDMATSRPGARRGADRGRGGIGHGSPASIASYSSAISRATRRLRHTPSEPLCARSALRSTRGARTSGQWTDKPNYFDITVWGQQGENCAQYLAKRQAGRDRRAPRVARVGGAGRQQASGSRGRRRQRAVPGRTLGRRASPRVRPGRSHCRRRRRLPPSPADDDIPFYDGRQETDSTQTHRADRRPAGARAATFAGTRSRKSTTRTSPSSDATSRRRGRSARGASPARAGGISSRSRPP